MMILDRVRFIFPNLENAKKIIGYNWQPLSWNANMAIDHRNQFPYIVNILDNHTFDE